MFGRTPHGVCSFAAATMLCCVAAHAAPLANPVYTATHFDAVTGDSVPLRTTTAANIGQVQYTALGNGGRFTSSGGAVSFDVDQFQPGSITQRADDYLNEVYERPTDQTLLNVQDTGANVRFGLDPGGVNYYGYLDIVSVSTTHDNEFLYVSMDLFSRDSVKTGSGQSNGENKLKGFYGFRIGENPTNPQSRGGYFIRFEQPTDKAGTTFDLDPSASVFRDVNNNVGGNSINGTVASTLEGGDITGDGHEVQVVADGVTNGSGSIAGGVDALYTRIRPGVGNERFVEFALRYSTFG